MNLPGSGWKFQQVEVVEMENSRAHSRAVLGSNLALPLTISEL